MIKSFRDLIVYQKAYTLALDVHKLSLGFPKIEQYELGSQIRRASKSVAINIAEGYARNNYSADFKRFLTIALGSCEEVKVQLDFCYDLGYMDKAMHSKYESSCTEIGKMLVSLIRNWK